MISTALPSPSERENGGFLPMLMGRMASGDRFGGRPDMTAAPCTPGATAAYREGVDTPDHALSGSYGSASVIENVTRRDRSIRIDARKVVDRADQQTRANDEHHPPAATSATRARDGM